MWRSLIIFTCLSFLYCSCFSFSKYGVGFKSAKYDMDINTDSVFTEYQNIGTATKCALFCGQSLQCMSFSLHKVKQRCRIYGNAGFSSEGWMHFLYGEKCPVYKDFIHDRDNNLCIRISEKSLNADDGEQFCTNISTKLVTLETVDKQMRFENFLTKIPSSGRYRIGLYHNGQQWIWNNGNPLSVSKWSKTEPSCSKNCMCGSVTVTDNGWTDNSDYCKNTKAKSFCEIGKY